MHTLLVLALVLAVLWFAGVVFFEVAGFLIHLALVAAALLVITYVVRKAMSGRRIQV